MIGQGVNWENKDCGKVQMFSIEERDFGAEQAGDFMVSTYLIGPYCITCATF